MGEHVEKKRSGQIMVPMARHVWHLLSRRIWVAKSDREGCDGKAWSSREQCRRHPPTAHEHSFKTVWLVVLKDALRSEWIRSEETPASLKRKCWSVSAPLRSSALFLRQHWLIALQTYLHVMPQPLSCLSAALTVCCCWFSCIRMNFHLSLCCFPPILLFPPTDDTSHFKTCFFFMCFAVSGTLCSRRGESSMS